MNAFEPPVRVIPPLRDDNDSDEVLAKLHRWADQADRSADELAKRGGIEREEAAQHLREAERYDGEAVAARERMHELRALIAFVEERRRQAAAGAAAMADHGPRDGAS